MSRFRAKRIGWMAMLVVAALLGDRIPIRADQNEPIEPLKGLSGLVGEWVSESKSARGEVEERAIRYRWINDGRCLEAQSERRTENSVFQVRILYYWDAVAQKIRCLSLGSDGSWEQAKVEVAAGTIRLDIDGGSPDGKKVSLVSTLEPGPNDTRTERRTKWLVDGKAMPDALITWRRKPAMDASATSGVASTSRAQSVPSLADSGATWEEIRAARQSLIDRYLRTAADGYAWFLHAMHGLQAGTPYLFFLSLPELAPDIWGPPGERLSRFGFLDEPQEPERPLPLGLGWVLDPVHGDRTVPEYHSVTLTCAACHVGQVWAGGSMLLVGAPNSRIDVRKFRRAMELTAERLLSEQVLPTTAVRLADLIKSKPQGFYFRGLYGIDTEVESRERQRFQDIQYSIKLLSAFAAKVQGGRASVLKQLQTSYSKPNAPPLDGGTPGQSDGSGDLIPKLILFREMYNPFLSDPIRRFLSPSTVYPEMPASATATDNMSVWNQWDRPFGQLDASIRSPVIRNVAAETAVVGTSVRREGEQFVSAVNVRNADICVSFLARLPPPPYPFAVDLQRARRGEALYREHCFSCHRAGNGDVYGADKIGTDMNRARVLSKAGKDLLLGSFKAAIPVDYVATNPQGGTYLPAKLSDDEIINDRVSPDRQGYAAGPLDGIWARAPYLHNGSVPTLRHLLAPRNPDSHRPTKFVRGSIRYDTSNVGFCWDVADKDALLAESPSGAVFDTGWDGASNQGHQSDVLANGKLQRLDWSGPDHKSELEDLLEYLKSL